MLKLTASNQKTTSHHWTANRGALWKPDGYRQWIPYQGRASLTSAITATHCSAPQSDMDISGHYLIQELKQRQQQDYRLSELRAMEESPPSYVEANFLTNYPLVEYRKQYSYPTKSLQMQQYKIIMNVLRSYER